jgi:hypothetical protein
VVQTIYFLSGNSILQDGFQHDGEQVYWGVRERQLCRMLGQIGKSPVPLFIELPVKSGGGFKLHAKATAVVSLSWIVGAMLLISGISLAVMEDHRNTSSYRN